MSCYFNFLINLGTLYLARFMLGNLQGIYLFHFHAWFWQELWAQFLPRHCQGFPIGKQSKSVWMQGHRMLLWRQGSHRCQFNCYQFYVTDPCFVVAKRRQELHGTAVSVQFNTILRCNFDQPLPSATYKDNVSQFLMYLNKPVKSTLISSKVIPHYTNYMVRQQYTKRLRLQSEKTFFVNEDGGCTNHFNSNQMNCTFHENTLPSICNTTPNIISTIALQCSCVVLL